MKYLLVGGTYDGRRKAVPDGVTTLQMMELRPEFCRPWIPGEPVPEKDVFDSEFYTARKISVFRRSEIGADFDVIRFFAKDTLTDFEAIKLLVDRYPPR